LKKFLIFIITLLLFFLGSFICPYNREFYSSLTIPSFAPPRFLFPIIWTTLYILISISVTSVYSKFNFKDIKEYNKSLIFNYIFNQSFSIFFFCLENLFFSFIAALFNFISALFLYYETKELDKFSSCFLIPYVLFSLYATIVSLTTYFLNLNLF